MSGTIDSIISWGRDLFGLSVSGSSPTGCAAPPSQEVAPANTLATANIALNQDELTAIMAMRRGRGNACSLHNMTTSEATAFWQDAARYLIETKYAGNSRNEDPNALGPALEGLADNQRTEVIARLGRQLGTAGHPYDLHNADNRQSYATSCVPRLFVAAGAYPLLTLNVSRQGIQTIIDEVRRDVAPETAGASQPAAMDLETIRTFLLGERAILQQLMGIFAPVYDLCVPDVGQTIAPSSGCQGQSLTGVTLNGFAHNLFGENNALPEGLTISFGEGITVTNPRAVNNELVVDLAITATAAAARRDIVITLPALTEGEQPREIGRLDGGFEVRTSGETGRTRREPRTIAPTIPTPVPATPPSDDFCLRNPDACL